jgi:hypothetical protein
MDMLVSRCTVTHVAFFEPVPFSGSARAEGAIMHFRGNGKISDDNKLAFKLLNIEIAMRNTRTFFTRRSRLSRSAWKMIEILRFRFP